MQHAWVTNLAESIPPGVSTCVAGPFISPAGATIFYDIADVVSDDMDVSVVADGAACDGSSGYAVTSATKWAGTQSAMTDALPGGRYDLALTCYNATDYCQPFLFEFGYED